MLIKEINFRVDISVKLLLLKSKSDKMSKEKIFRPSNKELCLSYLKKYSEKDLQAIGEMFSEHIILRDWKIRVSGKKNALQETLKNFEAADTIAIEVLATYENENTVAAELKIVVDDSEELYVVDVMTVDADHKIESIRAYLGRGDH